MKTTTFKTIRLRNYLVLLATVLILFSCKKEEEEDLSTGFSDDIENFVPDSTIQALRDLGMAINEGKEPPMLEGTYLASPYVMVSSNVPNESYDIGERFVDYKHYLKNQNNETLTIEMDREGINYYSGALISKSTGNGAFISGYNDDFTAFIILEGERYLSEGDTSYSLTLHVISGTIAQEGIQEFQSALLMLDDYGDEFDHYIPVNTGRVFHDEDSIAYREGFGMSKKATFIYDEKLMSIPSSLSE